MTWLVREELNLSDYQDCSVVYWPITTSRPSLHIELVEYDRDTKLGIIYHRDTELVEPKFDTTTGTCTFFGYEWSVCLVRRTRGCSLELPADAGALEGKFPDPIRGQWLVFSPASRKPFAELREPRPRSGQRNGDRRHAVDPKRPEAASPTSASTGKASAAASDIDLLGG